MKIFLDTLNTNTISEFYNMGILYGVTTNPTLAKRFGMSDDIDMISKIRKVMPIGEIHVEAFGKTSDEIISNAKRIYEKSRDNNLVFKIPFSTEGVSATKKLSDMKLKTNLHLIFSKNQALLSSCVGSTYICPLVGRLDDIGHDAFENLSPIIDAFKKSGSDTMVMVSSVRHAQHVIHAFESGADAATIPENVLRSMFNHPLTDSGYRKFHEDLRAMERINMSDVRSDLIVDESMSLRNCLKFLVETKGSCLAIVDENLSLSGVFTLGDLKRCLSSSDNVDLETPVSNFMNRSPIVAESCETYSEVNNAVIAQDITDIIIVDGNSVLGVLSCKRI